MGRVRNFVNGFVVASFAGLILTGCFTGERPTLEPPIAAIDDPAVAAVVELLEAPKVIQYTATYSIVTKLSPETIPPTTATVSQLSDTGRSITIGNIRFLDRDGVQQTCDLATSSCEPSLNDAKVSDLLVGHDFYAVAPAARLRQDALTMVSAALASTREIAGQTATCVQVNFAAGAKVYCANDDGLLAFQDTPDLQIDLVSQSVGWQEEFFTTGTVAGG